ncbi:MAG: glycosyltransferase [Betaproteobacteria bacterium]|nr:glycosyltransferase [Betaproteobacteria bacterium]
MLDDTLAKLVALGEELVGPGRFEIIAVDDGSSDASFACIRENAQKHKNAIRGIRLSRNFGAFHALQAGMAHCRGNCMANISQDMQEPTELFARMFKAWQEGVKINIGVRTSRDESWLKKVLAATYHHIFAKLVMPGYPKSGMCGFIIDRQIIDELLRHPNMRMDPTTKLLQMGYSPILHPYKRGKPQSKSNWTFRKNITLVIDNFIFFSFLPIRCMSVLGILIALASMTFTAYVLLGKLTGWYPVNQPPGWATIVVLTSFLSGTIMVMLGIIGEYLWRILEQVRNEPLYLIDEKTDDFTDPAD